MAEWTSLMLSRRNFILGLTAASGFANLPNATYISEDEYDLFNAVWSDFTCQEQKHDYIVNTTDPAMYIAPADARTINDSNITDRSSAYLFDKLKEEISREAVGDFYVANSKAYEIDVGRIQTDCAKFISESEASVLDPPLNAGEKLRNERN